jgi:IMP dehydrogenase
MQPDEFVPELPAKFAPLGLTYDDVLLIPGASTSSRPRWTPAAG